MDHCPPSVHGTDERSVFRRSGSGVPARWRRPGSARRGSCEPDRARSPAAVLPGRRGAHPPSVPTLCAITERRGASPRGFGVRRRPGHAILRPHAQKCQPPVPRAAWNASLPRSAFADREDAPSCSGSGRPRAADDLRRTHQAAGPRRQRPRRAGRRRAAAARRVGAAGPRRRQRRRPWRPGRAARRRRPRRQLGRRHPGHAAGSLGSRLEQQHRARHRRVERAHLAPHRDAHREVDAPTDVARRCPAPRCRRRVPVARAGRRRGRRAVPTRRRPPAAGRARGDRSRPPARSSSGTSSRCSTAPAEALMAAGPMGAERRTGNSTPWTPHASALRSSVPTFWGSSSESSTSTKGASPRSRARTITSSSVAHRRGSTTSATPW